MCGQLARIPTAINATGRRGLGIPCDVMDVEQLRAAIAQVHERFGRVDILVNNAHGFGPRADLEAIPEEQFNLSWRTGAQATWWAMCAVRPHMAAHGGGRIINFVSLAMDRGDAGLGDYAASKAAIASLTRLRPTLI